MLLNIAIEHMHLFSSIRFSASTWKYLVYQNVRLTPLIIKDSLHLIKLVDSSLAGDFEQSGESCNLQSTWQALSCRVSGSKGTVFYIVGQRDQLTAVDVVEAERGKRVWGEAAGVEGVGMCPLPVVLSLPCLFSLIPDASCCLSKTFAADLRTVSGSRPQSRLPYWETAA